LPHPHAVLCADLLVLAVNVGKVAARNRGDGVVDRLGVEAPSDRCPKRICHRVVEARLDLSRGPVFVCYPRLPLCLLLLAQKRTLSSQPTNNSVGTKHRKMYESICDMCVRVYKIWRRASAPQNSCNLPDQNPGSQQQASSLFGRREST